MFWNWITQAFDGFIQSIISFLPTSPFINISANIANANGIGWLNWFFPVGRCITTMALWLTAIGVYYGYSVIARWVKIIR